MEKAKVKLGNDIFWFGSVDGEEFLPLSSEPTEEDAEFIRENVESRKSKTMMRVMRGFLTMQGAEFAPLNERIGDGI